MQHIFVNIMQIAQISSIGKTCIKESDYGKNITSELTCITDQINWQIHMKPVVVCRLFNDVV